MIILPYICEQMRGRENAIHLLIREHVRTYHYVYVNYVVMFVTNNGQC